MTTNRDRFGYLRRRLHSWGVDERGTEALLAQIHIGPCCSPASDIALAGRSPNYGTLLLEGIACLYERHRDGGRQIFDFQFSGDFYDLNRHMLPANNSEVGVAAITDCWIGTIKRRDFDELIAQSPSLTLAVWRSTVVEANIFRKSLLNGRRPALERVAHLLCELLARCEAAGVDRSRIPVSQIDIADATGLSSVHVNRTFKELQRLGLLAKEGRTIKVVDGEQLARLAAFDGSYLETPQLLAGWRVEIERQPAPGHRSELATFARAR